MSCLLFFLCEDVKKCPCVIYIYLYTCTHTFSCRPHSLLFARESLWGWNAPTEPAGALRTPTVTQSFSGRFAHPSLTTNLCTSQLASRATQTHAASSRDGCGCCSGRGKTPSLISCKPSALGLELRPRAHHVVYYLNTNALALALGTHRYHGKREKAHMQWRNVTRVGLLEYFAEHEVGTDSFETAWNGSGRIAHFYPRVSSAKGRRSLYFIWRVCEDG